MYIGIILFSIEENVFISIKLLAISLELDKSLIPENMLIAFNLSNNLFTEPFIYNLLNKRNIYGVQMYISMRIHFIDFSCICLKNTDFFFIKNIFGQKK